ncbi:hypothetical protein NNL21_29890 [Paenibacillus mendelii]|nr:hypothetical protein [Paenibacillus mendelii]
MRRDVYCNAVNGRYSGKIPVGVRIQEAVSPKSGVTEPRWGEMFAVTPLMGVTEVKYWLEYEYRSL